MMKEIYMAKIKKKSEQVQSRLYAPYTKIVTIDMERKFGK